MATVDAKGYSVKFYFSCKVLYNGRAFRPKELVLRLWVSDDSYSRCVSSENVLIRYTAGLL